MQSLEAVLHLAWKAAEAAAKSIEFVSREGAREGIGRQSPQLDTGGSLEWGDDADRQTDWVDDYEEQMDGVLCRCCGLLHCTVWFLSSVRLESWPGLFPETRLLACLACPTLVEMRPWLSSSEHLSLVLSETPGDAYWSRNHVPG